MRLLRVGGFTTGDKKEKRLQVEVVAKNLEDRIASRKELRDKVLKEVADKMKKAGVRDLLNAFKRFDEDESGIITREELQIGFKEMRV